MDPFLFSDPFIATLVTPSGSYELYGVNHGEENWFVIGEKTIQGQEYWLMYECYTQEIGFIRKADMGEPLG